MGVESFLGGQKDRVTLSDFGPYRTALIQRLETSLRVPVYGNFSKGFPSTLVQGGTKEILLSGLSVFTKPSTTPDGR